MAVGSLSPVAIQQFFDNNGNPLAGGKLFLYLAGTTTPTPAYADVGLMTPLANPVILDAAGRAPELFLGALTYKQVLQNVLGTTIWTADNIITPSALRSTGTSLTLTGLQHDVAIPSGVITFLDMRNTAAVTIDGFAGGTPGQILIVRGFGTGQVNLVPAVQSTSQPGNQMIQFVQTGYTSLAGNLTGGASGGTAVYVKAGDGYWILVTHEQGGGIRLPYVAGNFTASAGTWTVDASDVGQLDYYLRGGLLLVTVAIQASVISAAPTSVRIAGWPYAWRNGSGFLPTILAAGAGYGTGLMTAAANQTVIDFAKPDFSVMVAGGLNLYAQASIDVL